MISLVTLMDGYTGFTNVLKGDGWSLKTHDVPPYRA
jgi:hypothetical protein